MEELAEQLAGATKVVSRKLGLSLTFFLDMLATSTICEHPYLLHSSTPLPCSCQQLTHLSPLPEYPHPLLTHSAMLVPVILSHVVHVVAAGLDDVSKPHPKAEHTLIFSSSVSEAVSEVPVNNAQRGFFLSSSGAILSHDRQFSFFPAFKGLTGVSVLESISTQSSGS